MERLYGISLMIVALLTTQTVMGLDVPVNAAHPNLMNESVMNWTRDNFVPYSGAINDVELGEHNLNASNISGDTGEFDKGILAIGSTTGYSIPTGAGTRLMWIPSKGAFRAGGLTYDEDLPNDLWDSGNIGTYSAVVGGTRNKASGLYSVALGGREAVASGTSSLAAGVYATASGGNAIALNYHSLASAGNAMSFGDYSEAIALNSVAFGPYAAKANGEYSMALGWFVTAQNQYSMVLGYGLDGYNPLVNNVPNSIALGVGGTDLLITSGLANFQDTNITTNGTLKANNYCNSSGFCKELNNWTNIPLNPFNQSLNTSDNVLFNNITANYFIGNGSLLTNIPSDSNKVNKTGDTITGSLTINGGGNLTVAGNISEGGAKLMDKYIQNTTAYSIFYKQNGDTRNLNSNGGANATFNYGNFSKINVANNISISGTLEAGVINVNGSIVSGVAWNPSANLVAHWKMNDIDASTTVVDSSANSLDGDAQQNTEDITAEGRINTALIFNGVDDYITVGDNDKLDITGNKTVCMWVNFDSLSPVTVNMLMLKFTAYNANGFYIERFGEGLYYTQFVGGNSQQVYVAGFTSMITINTWHHICFVKGGTVGKLYLDGIDRTTSSASLSATTANVGNLYMGKDPIANDSPFGGKLDDIRIYNKSLSTSEITGIYNANQGTEDESGTGDITYAGVVKLNAGATPATPTAGQIYFSGTHFYGYDGSTWKQFDN